MKTLGVLLLLAVAAAAVPMPAGAVERWYSNGIYPRIQSMMTTATNHIPIALLDVAAAILIAVGLVWFVRRARSIGAPRALLRGGVCVVSCAAGLYLLFLGLWGLNYRRVPLERKLDYEHSRVTRDAAMALANTAADFMNRGYPAAHAVTTNLRSLEAPFAEVQRALGAQRDAVPGVPKRSVLTWYFRRGAIDGMTDPFFLEIIVNPEVLDIERPFVVAHEWGHLAGWARESEASLVGWTTCMEGDETAQYSGWLSLFLHLRGDVTSESLARIDRALAAGPRADLAAISARLAAGQPAIQRASWGAYDQFLKANRVAEGVRSYDEVVTLVIGTQLEASTPQIR